jgi:hypothetical protein
MSPELPSVCIATALSEFYHEKVGGSHHYSLEFQAGPNGKRTANTWRITGDSSPAISFLRADSCLTGEHCAISASFNREKVESKIREDKGKGCIAHVRPQVSSSQMCERET